MSEQLRITPEEVIAAYQTTGLRVMQADYCCRDLQGRTCGCPIAALYLAGQDDPKAFLAAASPIEIADAAIQWAEATYGNEYHEGFTAGFDGDRRCGSLEGILDGQAVSQAVFAWMES